MQIRIAVRMKCDRMLKIIVKNIKCYYKVGDGGNDGEDDDDNDNSDDERG